MKDIFVIPLNGLPTGKSDFSWYADKEFFGSFDNSDILDADIHVDCVLEKSGNYMGIDLEIRGTVTVPCDRCLEDLEIPVEEERKLSVKFGNEPTSPLDTEEGERETVYFSTEEPVIDLRQIVYDYTCLAVPMQRVHKEGECNPAAVAHLSSESDVVKPKETATDNPFAALKDLLAKKQDS
ncbi:MAG: DUF177 domain-containing protein [Bacteroidales bacterium]|jgi:uncharacterized metal-binding protein YceD (DUF177 family)|nr:DUF177 domain-containing protein [Bacteroidales bacterium]